MKNELRGIQEALLDCSMLGFHMFDSLGFVSVKDPLGIWEITMAGAPYLFYNQATTDLDSTALALFALRVAAENGRLPKQTRRPVLSLSARMAVVKSSALEPLQTDDAIKKTLAAVEKARAADETWTEMNSHQTVKDFLWLRSIPVADNNTFMELPSPKTALSTIQGVASLRNAKLALDPAASAGKPLETRCCVTLIRDWLDDKIAAENLGGGNNSPFVSLFYISDVNTAPGSPIGRDWVLWSRVLDWLLKDQNIKIGSWGAGRDVALSSSLRARLKTISQPKDNLNLQQMYERAHMAPVCYNANHVAAYQAVDARITSTAYALMFLGDARNQDIQVDPFFAKTQDEGQGDPKK